jgi:hypothetical protein
MQGRLDTLAAQAAKQRDAMYVGKQETGPAPVRRSEIDRELSRIAAATEELAKCTDELWGRLNSVTSPTVTDAQHQEQAEGCVSDLGAALQRQAQSVERSIAGMRSLMSALAL